MANESLDIATRDRIASEFFTESDAAPVKRKHRRIKLSSPDVDRLAKCVAVFNLMDEREQRIALDYLADRFLGIKQWKFSSCRASRFL